MAQVFLHVTNAPLNASANGTVNGAVVDEVKGMYFPRIDEFSVLTINGCTCAAAKLVVSAGVSLRGSLVSAC